MNIYRAVLAVDQYELLSDARSIIDHHRNLELAGEAAISVELINLLDAVPADLAILSMARPNAKKLEVINSISKRHPCLKILFIRNRENSQPACQPLATAPWKNSFNPINVPGYRTKRNWLYT